MSAIVQRSTISRSDNSPSLKLDSTLWRFPMPKAKRIAVILSGCGHQDGAEITEAVSTLIALSEAGAHVEIFAPDINFESRNVLKESARIARGKIHPLCELQAKDFDGLAMPGGFGVALNLCDWAVKGAKCSVLPDAERVIKEFHSAESQSQQSASRPLWSPAF